MGIYNRVPRLRLIPDGDFFPEKDMSYSIYLRLISFPSETLVQLKLKRDREQGGKISYFETIVSSVFGRMYKIELVPDEEGNLEVHKGRSVVRLCKDGRCVPLNNPKYDERMRKNTVKILRKRDYRNNLTGLFKEGRLKVDDFSDNMAKCLGLEWDEGPLGYGNSGELKEALV